MRLIGILDQDTTVPCATCHQHWNVRYLVHDLGQRRLRQEGFAYILFDDVLTASQNRVFPAKRATSAALQPPLIPRRRSRASIQRWRSLSPPRARSASV